MESEVEVGTTAHAVGVSMDPMSTSLVGIRQVAGEGDEEFHVRVFEVGQEHYAPAMFLGAGAEAYRSRFDLVAPQVDDWTTFAAPWERLVEVGDAFAFVASNPDDSEVVAAYSDLVAQVGQQWDHLTGTLEVEVEFLSPAGIAEFSGDREGLNPYSTAATQRGDLVENRHLRVASIADYPLAAHPLLDSSRGGEYDRFRACHDAFGHAAIGADFTRHGEFQSWLHHSAMFYGPAKLAASTELTGENSYLASHHQAATHKAAILPQRLVASPWDGLGNYLDGFWR